MPGLPPMGGLVNGALLSFIPAPPGQRHRHGIAGRGSYEQRIAAFFDDRLITEATPATFRTVNTHTLSGLGEVKGSFTPDGGLGIFVRKGTASFKHVLIKPAH